MTWHPRLLFACILVLLGTGISGRSLEEIKRSGKIYAAFTRDDLNNINYDLAQEFARYLNVELITVVIDWNEAFMLNGRIPQGLKTDASLSYTPDALKKADIICSTFTMTGWRTRLFGFAETLQSAELLMIRKEDEPPEGFEDLKGKTIAFAGVTTIEQHLREIDRMIGGGIRLKSTGSSAETKELLKNGEVYGIVLDADEALAFNAGNGQNYEIAFPVSEVSTMAWAVEKNNSLAGEVESFFETIAGNGVLDEFFYKRFGITYSVYLERLDRSLRPQKYQRDLEEIRASKKIVVALRDRNFIYREGGPKQFMHALAGEFAEHLGVDLEFVVTPYFGKYWEAGDGQVYKDSAYTPEWFRYFDLACEVIAPLDWRSDKVELVPIYPSSFVVVARRGTNIESIGDLSGLRGVTNRESVYEEILKENGISDFYFEKVDQFIPDVASGKADYTIIYNAFIELSDHPDLEIKLELGNLNVCWAVRKDQPRLRAELESFIADSRESGLISTLMKAMRGQTLQSPEEFMHSYHETFQTGQLPYVDFGSDDGLPQEDILSIFQDRRGYLWFGTNSGAVRYNGRDMVVFDQAMGLPGNSVRDISQDAAGDLLLATDNGVARLRGDNTEEVLLRGIAFNGIFTDSKDRIWLLGENGLYVQSGQEELQLLQARYPSLPEKVFQVTEDPSAGTLLLATPLGIFRHDPEAGEVTPLTGTYCKSLLIDPNDSIWMATREGLFIAHVKDLTGNRNGAEIRDLNKSMNIPGGQVNHIAASQFGSVWLVTESRILQVISTDREPISYDQEAGLMNNQILSFLVDREDNLWIGFSGGLQRLANRTGLRNFFPATIDSYIYSIFEDGQDRIWISSDNGVFYFSEEELVKFTGMGNPGTPYTGTLLPDGNILLAGIDEVVEVDAASLQVLRRNNFGPLEHRPEMAYIRENELFLLTGVHGVVYRLRTFEASPEVVENRFTENMYHMVEYEGRTIGGTGEGFAAFDGTTFQLLEGTRCHIWSLFAEEKNLWAGTDCGIGLVRNGLFEEMEFIPLDGDLVVRSILPARNRNYLWLGTSQGFIYFDTQLRESVFIIDSGDGLNGDEITPHGLHLDRNGLLWVGTYHGISNFNIRAKSSITYAPVCYIERFLVNGVPADPREGQVFPPEMNNMGFEISALSFSDLGQVEYEYYLRGLENEFSSYYRGDVYKASYNNLPPGSYEFIYRARGKNSIWGYAEKFDFRIRVAWYNTWAFRLGLAFLLTILLIAAFRARFAKFRTQRSKLEQELREKTHDLQLAESEIESLRKSIRDQL